jgi:hypothetical protein
MCRGVPDASLPNEDAIVADPPLRVHEETDRFLWKAALTLAQPHLPSIHSRITYTGDRVTTIWFMSDVTAFPTTSPYGVPAAAVKVAHLNITHVTDDEYASTPAPLDNPSRFPSYEILHEAYNERRGGAHVILVYRDSSDAHRSKDEAVAKDRLLRHCRHFIKHL